MSNKSTGSPNPRCPATSTSTSSMATSQQASAAGSSSAVPTYPFQRAQRSAMWDFFDRTSVKEVKCKLCAKVLVYLGSTSSMREHMKRTHPQKLRPEDGEAKVGVPKTQAINTYFPASSQGAVNPNASRTCSPATAQRITNLIIDGLTADLRPLNLVHD